MKIKTESGLRAYSVFIYCLGLIVGLVSGSWLGILFAALIYGCCMWIFTALEGSST